MKVTVTSGRCYAAGDLAQGAFTLAGSVLTMDRALANLQAFTGVPLSTAIRLASHNPAVLLGLDASLSPGQPANFNIFNAAGHLQSTLLRVVATSAVAMEAAVS